MEKFYEVNYLNSLLFPSFDSRSNTRPRIIKYVCLYVCKIFMYPPSPVGLGIGPGSPFGKLRVNIILGCVYSDITRRSIVVLQKKISIFFFLYSFMLHFEPLLRPQYWFGYHNFVYWESSLYIKALIKILPYLYWFMRGRVLRHTLCYYCYLNFGKDLTFCLISWKPLLNIVYLV